MALTVLMLSATVALAQNPTTLERSVNGRTLISKSDPAVTLTFAEPFTYAGGQIIDIFHVAGAEQHFFVEAGPDKSVKRFYWIQFEHYYPANNHTYDYSGIRSTPLRIGKIEFLADTRTSENYFTQIRVLGPTRKRDGSCCSRRAINSTERLCESACSTCPMPANEKS